MLEFLRFFFAPLHEPWYHGAVWGNVVAVVPLGLMGFFWLRSKHIALTEVHAQHNRHLESILAALDPEAESETTLDLIADKVDETTPGGLGTIRERLETIAPKRSGKAVE